MTAVRARIAPPDGLDLDELARLTRIALIDTFGYGPNAVDIAVDRGSVRTQGDTGDIVSTADYSKAGALAACQMGWPELVLLCPLHAHDDHRRQCAGVPAHLIVAGRTCRD